MPSAKVARLTKDEITAAARRLGATRPAKWTVVIEGREVPVRPLVLEAAGVPPNDPTNSHQAVKILEERGFEVRYQGKSTHETEKVQSQGGLEDLIRSLRGRFRPKPGEPSLVELWEREHRDDRY
jgi:hypothetical protein